MVAVGHPRLAFMHFHWCFGFLKAMDVFINSDSRKRVNILAKHTHSSLAFLKNSSRQASAILFRVLSSIAFVEIDPPPSSCKDFGQFGSTIFALNPSFMGSLGIALLVIFVSRGVMSCVPN